MRLLILSISILLIALGSCRSAKKAIAESEGVNVEKLEHTSVDAAEKDATFKKKANKKNKRKHTARPKNKKNNQGGSSADDGKSSNGTEKVNIEELQKKAENGDTIAQTQLGIEYMKGEAVEKDMAKAIEWWTKAAEQGYTEAQYKLGVCHQFGYGVKRSNERARHWYEQAAKQHYAPAESALKTLEEE